LRVNLLNLAPPPGRKALKTSADFDKPFTGLAATVRDNEMPRRLFCRLKKPPQKAALPGRNLCATGIKFMRRRVRPRSPGILAG